MTQSHAPPVALRTLQITAIYDKFAMGGVKLNIVLRIMSNNTDFFQIRCKGTTKI